jgi:hypothetical protein
LHSLVAWQALEYKLLANGATDQQIIAAILGLPESFAKQ